MKNQPIGSDGRTWRRLGRPGLLLTVALAVGLSACGSDSSSESTPTLPTSPTTIVAPGQTTATTAVPARSSGSAGSAQEATKALCREIESAGRTVAEGRFVAGGLALSRAVNTHGDKADPTVVDPAKRMLAAGLNGDFDAGAAAVEDAASACARLGYPLNLPTGGGGGGGGGFGGGKQCVTTPCN